MPLPGFGKTEKEKKTPNDGFDCEYYLLYILPTQVVTSDQ